MRRVGVRFEGLEAADQARLDRYIFRQLRDEARRWRHLRGMPGRDESERRIARRIRVKPDGTLKLKLQAGEDGRQIPLTLQARAIATPDQETAWTGSLQLLDISSSGCAFLCPAEEVPEPDTLLALELSGESFALEVQGRVVYLRRATG